MVDIDPSIKAMAEAASSAQREQARQLVFPWQERSPAMPTDIARSAIFTARQDRDIAGQTLTKQIIPCEHAVLEYTGPMLNQSLADVWLSVVLLCRMKGKASVETRGGTLINMMREGTPSAGKRIQTGDRENLLKKVDTISKGQVGVKYNNGNSGRAHLLAYHHDEETDRYRLEIPAETLALFYDDHVLVDYSVRMLVCGQLAKWLHTYFAVNLTPVLLDTIRELSACQTKNDRKFRQLVGDALKEIVRASAERSRAAEPPALFITNAGVRRGYALVTYDPAGELPKLPTPKRLKP